MGSRHEWVVAAEKCDLEKLKELQAGSGVKPDGPKALDAIFTAAEKNVVEVVQLMLEWGTPLEAKDITGRRTLHFAAGAGSAAVVKLLCGRGVDIEARDKDGATALKVAIKLQQMKSAKELLMFDAELPTDASAPGLATCVREAQMDKLALRLKGLSEQPEVTNEELSEADVGVWQCQREHMRLLRLREEQRAGSALFRFDERTALEQAAAERSKLMESEHASAIGEKRVHLMKVRTDLTTLLRDLQGVQSTEMQMKAEDDVLRAELSEQRDELSAINSEIEARRSRVAGEQEELEMAEVRWQGLESEISEQREENKDEAAELLAAQNELLGWRRDREAAAKLTAQAHKLLGN